MSAQFVIRLDDVCPTMSWVAFERARDLFLELGIRPLIGIVPDNRDPDLIIAPARLSFWQEVRALQAAGWTIAQHGYQHIARTHSGGILNIGKKSEFAGVPLAEQKMNIAKGLAIFTAHGIESPRTFMAPFHSFDRNTLVALSQLNFYAVTDGFGFHPFLQNGLIFVPQLFQSGLNFGFGVYTRCLHTNNMTEKDFDELEAFCRANLARIISFDQALNVTGPKVLNHALSAMLRNGLHLLRKVR
jgi:predicted deacetylase